MSRWANVFGFEYWFNLWICFCDFFPFFIHLFSLIVRLDTYLKVSSRSDKLLHSMIQVCNKSHGLSLLYFNVFFFTSYAYLSADIIEFFIQLHNISYTVSNPYAYAAHFNLKQKLSSMTSRSLCLFLDFLLLLLFLIRIAFHQSAIITQVELHKNL